MTNLTELQSKFINNLSKEPANKKDFLDYLEVTGTMNKMQAGACITTLRKKGYNTLTEDSKTINLVKSEAESKVIQFVKSEETPAPKRRGRPRKTV